MTREEAKEVIKAYHDKLTNSVSNQLDGDIKAFEMAIQALSSWEKYSDKLWKKAYERGKAEALSQNLISPCDVCRYEYDDCCEECPAMPQRW